MQMPTKSEQIDIPDSKTGPWLAQYRVEVTNGKGIELKMLEAKGNENCFIVKRNQKTSKFVLQWGYEIEEDELIDCGSRISQLPMNSTNLYLLSIIIIRALFLTLVLFVPSDICTFTAMREGGNPNKVELRAIEGQNYKPITIDDDDCSLKKPHKIFKLYHNGVGYLQHKMLVYANVCYHPFDSIFPTPNPPISATRKVE